MEKVEIHQFDPVIYPVKLWVSITEDVQYLSERFIDYPSGKELSTESIDELFAFTQMVKSKKDGFIGVMVVFGNEESLISKYIAHESTHAARKIWTHLGENETGNEADAYLVGWIADCIEKVKLNKF